jgi:hypothetical protein
MSLFIEEGHHWVFLVLTVIIGGGAAFLAGRGMAIKWRPLWMPLVAMVPLTAGIRFLHFALFGAKLTSLHYFLADFAVLLAAAFIGYRATLAKKMTRQYPWLYEKAGPLSWRSKS